MFGGGIFSKLFRKPEPEQLPSVIRIPPEDKRDLYERDRDTIVSRLEWLNTKLTALTKRKMQLETDMSGIEALIKSYNACLDVLDKEVSTRGLVSENLLTINDLKGIEDEHSD